MSNRAPGSPPLLFANHLRTLPSDNLALTAVAEELSEARERHGRFASVHEAHSVIYEELRDVEEEVFKKRDARDYRRLRLEAVQLAAMAVKLAGDVELWSELSKASTPAPGGNSPEARPDPPPATNAGATHCPDGKRHAWQYTIETDGFRCQCGAEILPAHGAP